MRFRKHHNTTQARRIFGALAVLLAMLIVPLTIMGFRIETIVGAVTVEEAIEINPEVFDVTLYPGESFTQVVTLTNLSSGALAITLVTTADAGLIVTVPASVTVPANSSVNINILVRAGASIVPGIYNVRVGVDR